MKAIRPAIKPIMTYHGLHGLGAESGEESREEAERVEWTVRFLVVVEPQVQAPYPISDLITSRPGLLNPIIGSMK